MQKNCIIPYFYNTAPPFLLYFFPLHTQFSQFWVLVTAVSYYCFSHNKLILPLHLLHRRYCAMRRYYLQSIPLLLCRLPASAPGEQAHFYLYSYYFPCCNSNSFVLHRNSNSILPLCISLFYQNVCRCPAHPALLVLRFLARL